METINEALEYIKKLLEPTSFDHFNPEFEKALRILVEAYKWVRPESIARYEQYRADKGNIKEAIEAVVKVVQSNADEYVEEFLRRLVYNNEGIAWAMFKTMFCRNQGQLPDSVLGIIEGANEDLNEHITPERCSFQWLWADFDMTKFYEWLASAIYGVLMP